MVIYFQLVEKNSADNPKTTARLTYETRRCLMAEIALKLLDGLFSIHRFQPSAHIPRDVYKSGFFAACKTGEELSVVCPASLNLRGSLCDAGWAGIKIVGPIDLGEVGVLARISQILSAYRISIFAVSTYDTDYIFVKNLNVKRAVSALKNAGYAFL